MAESNTMDYVNKYYKDFREVCSLAWQRHLLSGFNGNVSVRDDDHICITRSGAAKGILAPEDLTLVTPEGVLRGGHKPSSELPMHLEIYAACPKAQAIVHCHPRFMLALELRVGMEFFLQTPLFEAEKLRARLGFAPALAPGTRALALAVAHAAQQHEAVWMSRHGITCHAENLKTALALADEMEHLAAVQLLTLASQNGATPSVLMETNGL